MFFSSAEKLISIALDFAKKLILRRWKRRCVPLLKDWEVDMLEIAS